MTDQRLSRGAVRFAAFDNPEMDFQLMRSLGAVAYGGGAVGEIGTARGTIADGDPASWVAAFGALASAVEAVPGSRHLRGAAALRASMYWRAAEYYSSPEDAAVLGSKSRAAFQFAMRQLAVPCKVIAVQLEGQTLTGYLLTPSHAVKPVPLLVALSGFDGSTEELYFEIGAAAVARGYACLMIEGPGQAGTRRENPNSIFRPDYAPVIATFIAALNGRRADIDLQRAALYGISFGGYFASQAIANGAPCQALIANSPILDLKAYMSAFIGPQLCADPPALKVDEIDEVPDAVLPPLLKHGLRSSCQRFGAESFAGLLERLGDFHVANPAAIRCPALAMYGEGEGQEVERQAKAFAAAVSGPVSLRRFMNAEGAGDHCQFGNLSLSTDVVLDWLDGMWS